LKFILLIFFVLAIRLDNAELYKFGPYLFLTPPADSAIVKQLYRTVVEYEPVFQEAYRCTLRQDVVICIPQSDRDYFKTIESALPDWSGGVALPDQRMVILRPGIYFNPREYREVLLHELAHIYMADKADSSSVPSWFNEGLAMSVSGQTFSWDDHLVISSAVISDNLLGLDEVDKMLVFGLAKARLAYAQSLLAVQFLIRNHGSGVAGEILDGLAAQKNWDQVFEQVTGSDNKQFTLDLQHFIQKEYRWAFLLQVKNLFWIVLVFLFLLGFILIKIRNRRILKEWEKNDST
jgi:hypothetical protein